MYCEALKPVRIKRLFIHKYNKQYHAGGKSAGFPSEAFPQRRDSDVYYNINIVQNGRNVCRTQSIAKDVQASGDFPLHCVLELDVVSVNTGEFTISVSGTTTQLWSETATSVNDDCVRISGQVPRRLNPESRLSPLLGIEYEMTV